MQLADWLAPDPSAAFLSPLPRPLPLPEEQESPPLPPAPLLEETVARPKLQMEQLEESLAFASAPRVPSPLPRLALPSTDQDDLQVQGLKRRKHIQKPVNKWMDATTHPPICCRISQQDLATGRLSLGKCHVNVPFYLQVPPATIGIGSASSMSTQ